MLKRDLARLVGMLTSCSAAGIPHCAIFCRSLLSVTYKLNVWQPCCLLEIRGPFGARTAASLECLNREWDAREKGCSESQRRGNDEIAKSGVGLSGHDVFVGRRVLGSAGEDGLRSRRELRAIQDLLVGTGQDQGCAGYRSNQECGQCRLGSKRLDAGGFRRRCFDRSHGDHTQSADLE